MTYSINANKFVYSFLGQKSRIIYTVTQIILTDFPLNLNPWTQQVSTDLHFNISAISLDLPVKVSHLDSNLRDLTFLSEI